MRLFALVAFLALLASADAGLDCLIEANITMRDGVQLNTCFDFPLNSKGRKMDCVIDRSPYGDTHTELVADVFLLDDYIAVRQDMRGTKQSGGNFTMWLDAANDAYDTMNYISQQEWSSGTIFSVGASADGLAVFAQPEDDPPWLKAATIIFASAEGHPIIYPGGAFRKSLTEFWLRKTVPDQYKSLIESVREHEAPGPWWNRLNATLSYHHVTYPTVMWAGWYDIFLVGQLVGFNSYQYLSPSAGKHRLVIDPLGHCQKGAKYFPYHTILGRAILPILLALETFRPTGTIPEHVKAITFYVMGAHDEGQFVPGNYWTSIDNFPEPTYTDYYLHAQKQLVPSLVNSSDTSSSYIFDPTNPVPSMGGNNLEIACGPVDQTSIESRSDVLLFKSAPLPSPVAITGAVSVTLYVSSNATDTDFTAKLTDVYPNDAGSFLIQDGIIRMRWRDLSEGGDTPQLMTPGNIYEVTLSLWNSSYVFNTNHSIQVAISSSNYPRFGVNPNNGLPLSQTGPNITASNTVHYGSSSHNARLTLPVVNLHDLPDHSVLLQKATDELLGRRSPEQAATIIEYANKVDTGEVSFGPQTNWVNSLF